MKPPKKILICGPTMIDLNMAVDPTNEKDQALMDAHKYVSNGKRTIDEGEFNQLLPTLEGRAEPGRIPGGSMFNTAITTKGVFGPLAEMTFLGMTGDDKNGAMIKSVLAKAGLKSVPATSPPDGVCGISFCVDPQGALDPSGAIDSNTNQVKKLMRSFATYAGNAMKVFTPDKVPELEKLVNDSDVVMMSGSVWEKVNSDMAHKLLELRWDKGKPLVLSLPVDPRFAGKHADYFQWVIPSANVVLANAEELQATYNALTPADARLRLQQEFQKHQLTVRNPHWGTPWKGKDMRQVGFITDGGNGAYIVTADKIEYVKCLPDIYDKKGKMNLSGAGDTAFAGFLLGYLNDIKDYKVCADIAMELANEKLLHEGPRIPNPLQALRQRMPMLASELFGLVRERFEIFGDQQLPSHML